MIDRALGVLGVDPAQWKALTWTYVRLDLRSAGGPLRRGGAQRSGASLLGGLIFISLISSVVFAFIAAAMPDVLISASFLTTFGAATTMMILLADFTGTVVSPNDYGILGHRPVSSRTFFAARLSAIFVYIAAVSIAIALLPAIAYGIRLAAVAVPATLLAVGLCNLSATVLVITSYVLLLNWIHPARLQRAMSYVQLAASASFYLVYWFAMEGFRGAFFDGTGFERAPWLWIVPSTWYAALIPLAGGGSPRPVAIAASAAILLTAACVPLAAGRLSLEYAQRIGEMAAAGEPSRRRRAQWLPGFATGEWRAMALLIRAQFRYEPRFRLAILGIIPLIGFYVLLGLRQGALNDPFVGDADAAAPGVFFGLMFMPMTLHAALSVSESWRAAWIFFVTPASHARIIVAAKNVVAVYFIGGYVLAIASFWSFFYERVWHAFVHAIFAGLLGHLLLQLTVMMKPMLPFSAEPRRAERSTGLFVVFFAAAIVAGVAPSLLHLIYRHAVLTFGALAFLVAGTAVLEYALRLRVTEAIGDLEFRM